jgi:protein SCO1/2
VPRLHIAAGALALAVCAALLVTLWPRRTRRDPPPVIAPVPAFALTDQEGRPFASGIALRGRPWVANFIFTRCTTVCPIFTGKMARLDARLKERGDDAWLVSFSVDPEHDTPEVLRRYATERGAPTERWSFLSGSTADILRTVTEALKIHIEKVDGAPIGQSIMHGTHFVVVDAEMNIRGYYDLADDDALDRILSDLSRL